MSTRTKETAAEDGAKKLTLKLDQMANSWAKAKTRMIDHYRSFGFGPTRTANYESAINSATYRKPNVQKWRENWLAKMSE